MTAFLHGVENLKHCLHEDLQVPLIEYSCTGRNSTVISSKFPFNIGINNQNLGASLNEYTFQILEVTAATMGFPIMPIFPNITEVPINDELATIIWL